MNVLIVDDELDYRLLLGRLLHQKGNIVFLARNGREALLKLRIAQMDLIITDVYMPVMDGFSLHRAVRNMRGYEAVPVLFVSAYEEIPAHKANRDPRLDAFHKKERPVEELLARVESLTRPMKGTSLPHPLRTQSSRLVATSH